MGIVNQIRGNYKRIALVLFDILCFLIIDYIFYVSSVGKFITYVSSLPVYMMHSVILVCCMMFFRIFFGVYRTVWRYTSTRSYFNLILSDCLGGISASLIALINHTFTGVWFYVIVAALTAHASIMARLSYRLIYKKKNDIKSNQQRKNTAIVGAGQLGTYLANDLRTNNNSQYIPLFFIDSNVEKIGNIVAGLEVYDKEKAKHYIEKFNITDVIISISEIDSEKIAQLYYYYKELGCNVKIFDSLVSEHGKAESAKKTIRDFSIEDLLFREPLKINGQQVLNFYSQKTVLVTGGGGSIGSEICRQIAKCDPKKLIIVDNYENNAYEIQQELQIKYGEKLDLMVEIASVQDAKHLEMIFRKHRPDIVFHAAAHKHVPLMEHSGFAAVKNNVMGTYNTANMAEKFGVKKFIMISTDKAVNPTNVMGATKRMCEMVIQCRKNSETCFAAVRFGNVLGSNGSVIPLFKKQIAAGGPVTITDKRIIRYFMTIQEASQLVIQAGAMAKRGELFVLNMGKPVKIYDLAVNMIKLCGYEPNVDIEIKEIGLRPGEKLYEELLIKTENMDKTENEMIFIERDTPLSREAVEDKVTYLKNCALAWDEGNGITAREALSKVVPTFYDPNVLNEKAEASEEMQMMQEKEDKILKGEQLCIENTENG